MVPIIMPRQGTSENPSLLKSAIFGNTVTVRELILGFVNKIRKWYSHPEYSNVISTIGLISIFHYVTKLKKHQY